MELLRHTQIEADDPLYQAAAQAFKSREHWDAFEQIAQERRREIKTVRKWLRNHGDRAAYQRGAARRIEYARVIREQLLANGGRAGRRRQIDDPALIPTP